MALPRRLVSDWLPVLVWAGVIFALSAQPHLSSGLSWDFPLRKGAHVTEYAILAALLVRAIGRALPAFGLAVLYAASDEFHQSFVSGRHGSPVDVGIDACGVLIGVLAMRRLLR